MTSDNYTPCLHDPFLILSLHLGLYLPNNFLFSYCATEIIYAFFFPFMRATFSSYPLDLIALLTFDEAPHCAVFFIVLLFALISVQTLSSACPQTSESASLPEGARLYPVFGRNVLEKETREWKFGNSRKCKNNDGNMMRDEPCRPARAYPPPSPGPYSHRDAYVFTTNTSHPAVVQCVPSSLRAVLQGQLHKRVCLLFKPGVGTHKAIFFCR